MEIELWDELRVANEELIAARDYAVERHRDKDMPNSDEDEVSQDGGTAIPVSKLVVGGERGLRNRATGITYKDQWGT
jgi:hypothetical protein